MAAAHPRPDAPKPLGVRATPEQRRILAEAAKREHRSVSSFVLRAALQAAETAPAVERQEVRNRLKEVRPGLEIATVQSGEALAAFAAQRQSNRQKVEAKHHKPEEVRQVLAGLRQAVQASPLAGRDLVAELIAERRAEALHD